MKRGKNYQESAKLRDRSKLYDVDEAMDLVVQMAKAKFDETVEAHIKLVLTPVMRTSRLEALLSFLTEQAKK